MKTKITVVIFLIFVTAVAAGNQDDILIKIDLTTQNPSRLAALPIHNHYRQDDMMFATTTGPAITRLLEMGFRIDVLDETAWDKNYFFLEPVPGTEAVFPADPLWQNQQGALIERTAATTPLDRRFRVTPLSRQPLPLVFPAVKHVHPLSSAQEPVIRSLVNRVSDGMLTASLQRLQAFRTRYAGSDSVYAAGQWLYDKFREFGYRDVVFDTLTVWVAGKIQRNIIATKTGTVYPDSVIIIGGHYDSIVHDGNDPMIYAPGVDDNGTGTVAVLEAARLLADIDLDCTVKFACWAAEELGLYGSTDWAARAYQNNLNIGLYINFDMIGNVDPNSRGTLLNIATNEASRHFAELMKDMAEQYTSLQPRIYIAGGASDHVPFQQRGYYFVYGSEGDFSPNWHKITDTIENVSVPYFNRVVKTGLATLAAVAGPPESIDDTYVTYSDFIVNDDIDGNNNGFIDPGETIRLTVNVKNIGSTAAQDLTVQLTATDPLVSIVTDTVSGIDLAAGETSPVVFQLHIDDRVPAGHLFILKLVVRDPAGRAWENYVHLKVEQPVLRAVAQHIEELDGNGDRAAGPGETCRLTVDMENTGGRIARDITATLSTNDPDIQMIKSTSVFPAIEKGAVRDNISDPWTFSIAAAALPHLVECRIDISEGGGYYRRSFPVYILLDQEPVLLVADDEETDAVQRYTDAMQNLGIPPVVWDNYHSGTIGARQLAEYESVIWYCGAAGRDNLSTAEQDLQAEYLDNGGNLLLSGEFIGYHLRNSPFYRNYLHAAFAGTQTQLFGLTHTMDNPVTGLDLILNAEDNIWPTEIDPLDPAVPILKYEPGTGTGTIRSSGTAALGVQTALYKLVYCSFKIESILGTDSRSQFIKDVMEWFNGAPLDIRPQLAVSAVEIDDDSTRTGAGNDDGFANPGENIYINLLVSNSGDLAAENVEIRIAATDTGVTVIDSTAVAGRIEAQSGQADAGPFVIGISPAIRPGHTVNFDVGMTGGDGRLFRDQFGIEIVLSHAIAGQITDAASGNGVTGCVLWREANSFLDDGSGMSCADSSGFFTLPLPQGEYVVSASAENFATSKETAVLLDGRQELNFELYKPRLSSADSILVHVPAGGTVLDTLLLQNTGNGVLDCFIYESAVPQPPARHSYHSMTKTLKQLPIQPVMPAEKQPQRAQPKPDDWKILYRQEPVDENKPAVWTLDVHRDRSTLYFRHILSGTKGHTFDTYVFFDTDANSETGLLLESAGADYLVLYQAPSAIVLQWSAAHRDFRPVVGNSQTRYLDWDPDSQALIFGIRTEQLGNPQNLNIVSVLTDRKNNIYDFAPKGDFGAVPFTVAGSGWLAYDSHFRETPAGEKSAVVLSLDASKLQPGVYITGTTIQSNGPQTGTAFITVTLNVGQTGIASPTPKGIPDRFALHQNYPNPFSVRTGLQAGTTVRYQLPQPEKVRIEVYNILGRHVATLVDARRRAGYHDVRWDGRFDGGRYCGSGIYFIRYQAGDYAQTRKMLLIR